MPKVNSKSQDSDRAKAFEEASRPHLNVDDDSPLESIVAQSLTSFQDEKYFDSERSGSLKHVHRVVSLSSPVSGKDDSQIESMVLKPLTYRQRSGSLKHVHHVLSLSSQSIGEDDSKLESIVAQSLTHAHDEKCVCDSKSSGSLNQDHRPSLNLGFPGSGRTYKSHNLALYYKSYGLNVHSLCTRSTPSTILK